MLQSYLSGDKGPFFTLTSFLFGSVFVAIVVGILTIIEKVTALRKNKNK